MADRHEHAGDGQFAAVSPVLVSVSVTPVTLVSPCSAVIAALVTHLIFGSLRARSSMIALARNSSRRCTIVTDLANRVRNVASSIAESPPPTTMMSWFAEEESVTGRAGRDAAADQPLLVRQVQVAGRGPGGQHDRPGPVLHAVDGDRLDRAAQVDGLGVHGLQVGAETLGLLADLRHQLGALDALREAGEVLHLGGGHQRAAVGVALEHQRLQFGAGQIDRRGVAGGTGADDDHVVAPVLGRTAGRRYTRESSGSQNPLTVRCPRRGAVS